MIPHKQGKRQSPLLDNKSSSLVRASSTGKVGSIVGVAGTGGSVGNGLGEAVGNGVNEGAGVALLAGREGVSEDRIVMLSVDCAQLESSTTKSIKLKQ
ncbi:MAG TPA: hypothetical protein VFQ23_18620 [Anaerolineales bacterium]|nr:hypothetical protein [Anaerolineales bacterium]